jgi:hypothetical protein
MKPAGSYSRPKVGEKVVTPKGIAFISRIIPYGEVIEEMRQNGLSKREIERFNIRVEHFLGKKSRYFGCELSYPNGETTRIDCSEYLFLKAEHKA